MELLGKQCVGLDVNSMKPLDNLGHPISVIKEAEDLTADAFGAAHAFLMVNGTTSSVQTMILSVCKAGDKILIPRNVHKSVINAMVLCGAIPVYVEVKVNPKIGIALGVEVDEVRRVMDLNPDAKAILINNPTYYGICSNLKEIVKIAHEHGYQRIEGGKVGHISFCSEAFEKTVLDFYMLSRASRIVRINSPLIYGSTFPIYASFMGNCPIFEYSLEEKTLTQLPF